VCASVKKGFLRGGGEKDALARGVETPLLHLKSWGRVCRKRADNTRGLNNKGEGMKKKRKRSSPGGGAASVCRKGGLVWQTKGLDAKRKAGKNLPQKKKKGTLRKKKGGVSLRSEGGLHAYQLAGKKKEYRIGIVNGGVPKEKLKGKKSFPFRRKLGVERGSP